MNAYPETPDRSMNNKSVLKKGDRVRVMNSTLSGEKVIEGEATIVAVYSAQGRYKVHFDGDPKSDTFERFLTPQDKI